MLYKSPCRRHRCHYVSFASEEVEVRKEKKEDQKNTFVYLKNRKSSLKQKKNNRIWSRKKTLKNLITIETIYQSLLTWRNYTKNYLEKTKQTLESNYYSLLKLETWNRSLLKKRKTNIKKANYVYCLFGTLNVCKKQNEVCLVLENKKEKKIEEKRKKYEVQLTRNYKRKV